MALDGKEKNKQKEASKSVRERDPASLGHQTVGQPANPHHVLREEKLHTERHKPLRPRAHALLQHSSVNPVAKGLRTAVKSSGIEHSEYQEGWWKMVLVLLMVWETLQ